MEADRPSASSASAAASETTHSAPAHPEILIVDDDRMVAMMQQRMLEKGGYSCCIANDAESAWKLLSPELSLVLLDVSMPGQNGPEILRRMRRDPTLAGIPVIFVTGRSDPATRIQCLTMGAVDFIVKPFSSAKLIETVRRAIDQPGTDEVPDEDEKDPLEAALESSSEPGTDLSTQEMSALPPTEMVRGLLVERRATRRSLAGHRRVVSALFRLHQAISADISLAELGSSIVALSQKALRATRATLWLESGRSLRALAHRMTGPSPDIDLSGDEAPARAWRESLTIERRCPTAGEVALHFPLAVGTERIGVLSLEFPPGQRPSESLASFFCAEVALALDWARRLERAETDALTDALTGVHNRRSLELRLGDELRRARALGSTLSVLFIDIDHFKWFNDSFGHDAGDRLLQTTARRIAAGLRGDDLVARYGGDEFVIVLPGADRAGAELVAARIHTDLSSTALDGSADGSGISFTIGAATYPEDADAAADLLASADAALLRGKRAGRDRVESFSGKPTERRDAPSKRSEAQLTLALRTLLAALDLRDPATGVHSRAVAGLSARVARQMGLSVEEIRFVGRAAVLHDIGKLHTPLQILLKPGPLDPAERAVMDQHAAAGADLVESIPPLRPLAFAVRASQEHIDGNGYPEGLAGEEIPLAARIIAVADAYHAMRSDRPYRSAMPHEAAVAELDAHRGTQFDPSVVDALLAVIERTPTTDDAEEVMGEATEAVVREALTVAGRRDRALRGRPSSRVGPRRSADRLSATV